MDFDKAIQCHVQWKSKLAAYIAKPDHSLNPTTVAHENGCDLGKWLHGEGQKFSRLPEFVKLVTDHTRFHSAAADVIKRANAGQRISEEVALGAKSEYASASNGMVSSLMKMKRAN